MKILDIENVIDLFDQHLDENNRVSIDGATFCPCEVLKTMEFKLYTTKLNNFIEDNFHTIDNDLGYISNGDYYG